MRAWTGPLTVVLLVALAATSSAVDPDVRRMARSDDLGDRRKAALALAEDGSPSAVKLLRDLIDDEYPWVRDWAIQACGKLKNPDGIEALLSIATRGDPLQRRNGVAAVGRTKSTQGCELLRELAVKATRPSVRREAVHWLRYAEEDEKTTAVLGLASADRSPIVRAEALLVLTSRRSPRAAELAAARLDDPKEDEGVRCVALRVLALRAPDEARKRIARFHPTDGWRARVQAVESALHIGDVPCLELLIELMGHDHPRIATDAHEALRRLTGLQYGRDAELWSRWLETNRATWRRPKELHSLTRPEGGSSTTASYHGIEVESRGAVFVIDTSGSMQEKMTGKNARWTRWGIAEFSLNETLKAVPDGVKVNVVLFDEEVEQAFRTPRALTDKVREQVAEFLAAATPGGNTNIEDTLQVITEMPDIDTVFLLGDGDPNRGPFVHETRIAPYFWKANRRLKLRVHTISIGADDSGRELLLRLSRDNDGSFVAY